MEILAAVILVFIGSIASTVGAIILLIAAFRRSVVTGILYLFVPFYCLYFALAKYESENKGKVLLLWLGSPILAWTAAFIVTGGAVVNKIVPHLQQEFSQISEVTQTEAEDSYQEIRRERVIQAEKADKSLEQKPIEKAEMEVEDKKIDTTDYKPKSIRKSKPGTIEIQKKEVIKQNKEPAGPSSDTIYFKDRRPISGKIVDETDSEVAIKITVPSGYGIAYYNKEDIEKIYRVPEEK